RLLRAQEPLVGIDALEDALRVVEPVDADDQAAALEALAKLADQGGLACAGREPAQLPRIDAHGEDADAKRVRAGPVHAAVGARRAHDGAEVAREVRRIVLRLET